MAGDPDHPEKENRGSYHPNRPIIGRLNADADQGQTTGNAEPGQRTKPNAKMPGAHLGPGPPMSAGTERVGKT